MTNTSDWTKTGEDRLLEGYRTEYATPSLFLEVGIGGVSSPWPGSAERRIDGVAVATGAEAGLFRKREFGSRWADTGNAWTGVDLLEAKAGLSEGVIGQLLAAKPMFERHREVAVAKLVAAIGTRTRHCAGWPSSSGSRCSGCPPSPRRARRGRAGSRSTTRCRPVGTTD